MKVHILLDSNNEPRWHEGDEIGSQEAQHRYLRRCGLVDYFIDCGYSISHLGDFRYTIRKQGYENFSQLILDKVFWDSGRYPLRSGSIRDCGIHVVIPHHHIHIASVEYDREKVEVSLQGLASDDSLSDFFLTARVHTAFEEMLSPIKIDPLERRIVSIPVQGDKYSVEVELWWKKGEMPREDYVDKSYGKVVLSDKNVRAVSYLHFDPELKALHRQISPNQRDNRRFEWAVSTLMHLAGFDVAWLGFSGKLMEGEIDVLGFAPGLRTLLAAECTTKSDEIEKKVAGLYRKIGSLERALKDWKVVGALFTNLESESLTESAKETASSQGISLIATKELKELLSVVRKDTPLKTVLQEIRYWIPIRWGSFVR